MSSQHPGILGMIHIAQAQLSQVPEIKHVLSTTWHDTYGSFLPVAAIERVSSIWHSPDRLRSEIEGSKSYSGVAKTDDGEIVAMVTSHQQGDVLFVSRLYVVPDFQRYGLGHRLLEASYAAFPGTTRVRLDVEEKNPVGRAFYHKLGFADVGRISNDVFGTRLESIVMEREIVRVA